MASRYYNYDKVVAEGKNCSHSSLYNNPNPRPEGKIYCFDNMIFKICIVDTLADGTFDPKLVALYKAFNRGMYVTCTAYTVGKEFIDSADNRN